MSRRDQYPAGVPCYVETVTADPEGTQRFYGAIFGWEFAGSGPLPGPAGREYFVARVDGDTVAGIAPLPPDPLPAPPPAWHTHVAVDDVELAVTRAATAGGTVVLEPFDALPAGRLAVVADPSGGVVGLWEAADRPGAGRVNEPSAWAMSMLTTDDPEAAESFYGELFGWEAEPFEPVPGMRMWLWRLPGFVGGEPQQPVPRDVVAAMAGGEAPGARWDVDFWIHDADRAAQRAAELGGAVLQPPAEAMGFRRAALADPQGAAFSVSQLLVAH